MARTRPADTVDAIIADIANSRGKQYLNAPFPQPQVAKVVEVGGKKVVGYRFGGNLFDGFGFLKNFARVASLLDEQNEQLRETATSRVLVGNPSYRKRGPKRFRLGAEYDQIGYRRVREGNTSWSTPGDEVVGAMLEGDVLRASADLAAAPLALKAYRALFGKTNMGPGHNHGHSTGTYTAQRMLIPFS